METKKCSKCNEVKNISEFWKDKKTKNGLHCYCKQCFKINYYKHKERPKKYKKKPYNSIYNRVQRQKIKRNLETINEKGIKHFLNNIKSKIKKVIKNPLFYTERLNEILHLKEKINEVVFFDKIYVSYIIELTDFIINRSKELKQYEEQSCVFKYCRKQRDKIYRRENKEFYKKYYKEYQSNKLKKDPIYKFSTRVRSIVSSSFKRGINQLKKTTKTEQILGCTIEEFRKHIESQFKEGMTFENHGKKGWHLDHIIPISKATTEEEVIKLNHYTNFQPLWWHENISKGNKIY